MAIKNTPGWFHALIKFSFISLPYDIMNVSKATSGTSKAKHLEWGPAKKVGGPEDGVTIPGNSALWISTPLLQNRSMVSSSASKRGRLLQSRFFFFFFNSDDFEYRH